MAGPAGRSERADRKERLALAVHRKHLALAVHRVFLEKAAGQTVEQADYRYSPGQAEGKRLLDLFEETHFQSHSEMLEQEYSAEVQ